MTNTDDLITYDYSVRDHEIVDYEYFTLPGVDRALLRGPAPDLDATWFACVGAAQTMGIFVPEPFPELVSRRIGLPALNLGLGGAWPGLFVDICPELLEWAGRGRFVVLQVMSARGEGSSRFTPTPRIEQQRDEVEGDLVPSVVAWNRMIAQGAAAAESYVAELRHRWIESNLRLIERLDCPVVLFWFSRRDPDEQPVYSAEGNAFQNMGEFPHFVDRACLDAVAQAGATTIECRSTRNTGHALVSRFTGEPVVADQAVLAQQRRPGGGAREGAKSEFGLSDTHNTYYPSPEMHLDAAEAVVAGLRAAGLVPG